MKMSSAIKTNYLYLNYLRDFRGESEWSPNNFRARFLRYITQILALVGRYDLCGKNKLFGEDQAQNSHKFLGLDFFNNSDWWQRQRYRWVSSLCLILYVAVNLYLAIILYYQYAYDFNKLRQERLSVFMRQALISSGDFARLSAIFLERAYESRKMLLIISAPYKHFSIVTECLYLSGLSFAFVLYFMNSMYYRLVTPFDFHFIRELLDYSEERHYSDKLVHWKVRRFLQSNQNFLDIDSTVPQWLNATEMAALFGPMDKCGYGPLAPRPFRTSKNFRRCLWQKLTRNENRMQEVLVQMLTSGALKPYNKSSRWIETRIMTFYLTLGSLLIFTAFFTTGLFGVAFFSRDQSLQIGLGESALISSALILTLLTGIASIFTASTVIIATLDQLVMVNKMRELILAALYQNERHLGALVGLGLKRIEAGKEELKAGLFKQHNKQPSNQYRGWTYSDQQQMRSILVDLMNSNLLFVILHYKIFIEQYKPSVKMAHSVTVFAIGIIILITLIIKLHSPYLNLLNYHNVQRFVLVLPTFWTPINSILVPLCHLDSRFIKLSRVWWSLMGHILETSTHAATRDIYDRHLIALLFKETANGFRFVYKPKWRILTLRPNYVTLLRAHFWWGVLLLSIIIEDLSADKFVNQASNSIFNDPFRVFSESNFLGVH